MSAFTVLLALGATFRLTRLAVVDEFPPIARVREWVTHRFGEDGSVAYLVACVHCSSVWIGAAVAYSAYLWGESRWWQSVALAFTASAVTGLVSAWEQG